MDLESYEEIDQPEMETGRKLMTQSGDQEEQEVVYSAREMNDTNSN